MIASEKGNIDRYQLIREKLRIGQAMPCHAFTRYGVLLLAQGEILTTPTQLDRLSYPDVIFSNEPPPVLVPAILERQTALGIIENGPIDSQFVEEMAALPVGQEFEEQSIELKKFAPTASFAEELLAVRELYQDTAYYVVDLLAQVRVGKPIDLYETTTLVTRMLNSLQRNARALTSLVRLKNMDTYTFTHSINTCIFSLMLARHVNPKIDLNALGIGALLHDIGKTFLPPDLLSKEDSLTQSEWELIRMHPEAGVDVIKQAKGYQKAYLDAILQHHERLDGTGYPSQLGGEGIAPISRIVSIADVYDAMTSERPYRASFSPPMAMRWLNSEAGVLFDRELVRTFIAIIGIFPVASLARMNTGELAIVVKVNPQAVLKPIVLVVSDADGSPLFEPKLINLALPPFLNSKEILGLEDPHFFKIDVDKYLASVSEERITELENEPLSISTLDILA
jgi:HD-GYP domain-containing protein (c-di-GMP phosphodiesterase class II)